MKHTPRKRFGQHFLCDKSVINRIIAAINPKSKDQIVEIGPGQGALTFPLLKECLIMDAVELDRDLIDYLNDRSPPIGELIVHQGDVLKFDFSKIRQAGQLLKVVGNLPYNISTPLIFHLLEYSNAIEEMVFMLQKEVAERLAAEAGSEHIGRLSIMVQYYCKVDLLFHVPSSAFYPPPKVDSSVIRLIPYKEPPYKANDPALFTEVVRQAFGQRRKTLRNSLRKTISDEAWKKTAIKPETRPEQLGVKEFVELSNIADLGRS